MKTISFSVEDIIAKDIAKIARQDKKNKSDVLRDMYRSYMRGRSFNTWLQAEQRRMKAILQDLTIKTGRELEDYLESDQIYEDRLRQQRLSARR